MNYMKVSLELQNFISSYQALEKKQHNIMGFNYAEVHLLVLIKNNPNLTLTDLATLKNSSRSSITQLTNKLISKKALFKMQLNKKSYTLVLTSKGNEIVEYHNKEHEKFNDALNTIFSHYNDDFFTKLVNFKNEILDYWEDTYGI